MTHRNTKGKDPPDLTGQIFFLWSMCERLGPRDYGAYHMSCLPEVDPAARIRFIDPANASLVKLWAGFKHRLFSQLDCSGQYAKGEIPFVVLPYHDGSTYLSVKAPVPPERQEVFCRDLLEAAVEATDAGVDERIFVCDSIWMDDEGRPRLDFPSQHEPEAVGAQLFTLLHLALTGRRLQAASRIAVPFFQRSPRLNPQLKTLMEGLLDSNTGLQDFLQGLDLPDLFPAIG